MPVKEAKGWWKPSLETVYHTDLFAQNVLFKDINTATGLFLTIQFSAQMSSLTILTKPSPILPSHITLQSLWFTFFLFFVYCILPLFVTYYILFIYLLSVLNFPLPIGT